MTPFSISRYRLTLAPRRPLVLPAGNTANVIRGAFGTVFRKLICEPECKEARSCEIRQSCAYARVFEPAPPPESQALSKNESIPRGFLFRAGGQPRPEKVDGPLTFELLLFGSSNHYQPSFVLAFSQLAEEGFGANRAPTELSSVDELPLDPVPATPDDRVTLRFLTPTHLVAGGVQIRQPAFHHVFKRLRDRINSLATFYGSGPITADFAGLGAASETVETVRQSTRWHAEIRRSSRTGQRHELSGFVGEGKLAGDLGPFREWLELGQHCHVGKHAVWGNGRYLMAHR